MTLFWQFGTFWLPWLLVISSCMWIILGVKTKPYVKHLPSTLPPPSIMPEVRKRGEVTIWIGSMMMTLAVGLALGYAARDHELLTSSITYDDVYVQSKISDRHFVMRPSLMSSIESELCAGSLVDWQEGETLKNWTFEQQRGCKRVISYHRYNKGELNVSVSNGR